uniref:Uncharacterized protein n=1 Tax=Chromera velia CCMP2878 TaxID=1169474 RepID=A0A0G4GXF0_9ALVE|eukprot:Cvel_5334.t1-p1 / transcript=Cvel_5334.t1 / gene=Cvel_5334 / organism=Chromera_velia_CCMP2878 / gene_product=hypothetical protein / transcript_product=hypothetical protein / location=Cvel_scaffold247:45286-47571(+) / protein_length=762 / sequence_SO=supercontig / SO=protein_coding / is_pseudo=false
MAGGMQADWNTAASQQNGVDAGLLPVPTAGPPAVSPMIGPSPLIGGAPELSNPYMHFQAFSALGGAENFLNAPPGLLPFHPNYLAQFQLQQQQQQGQPLFGPTGEFETEHDGMMMEDDDREENGASSAHTHITAEEERDLRRLLRKALLVPLRPSLSRFIRVVADKLSDPTPDRSPRGSSPPNENGSRSGKKRGELTSKDGGPKVPSSPQRKRSRADNTTGVQSLTGGDKGEVSVSRAQKPSDAGASRSSRPRPVSVYADLETSGITLGLDSEEEDEEEEGEIQESDDDDVVEVGSEGSEEGDGGREGETEGERGFVSTNSGSKVLFDDPQGKGMREAEAGEKFSSPQGKGESGGGTVSRVRNPFGSPPQLSAQPRTAALGAVSLEADREGGSLSSGVGKTLGGVTVGGGEQEGEAVRESVGKTEQAGGASPRFSQMSPVSDGEDEEYLEEEEIIEEEIIEEIFEDPPAAASQTTAGESLMGAVRAAVPPAPLILRPPTIQRSGPAPPRPTILSVPNRGGGSRYGNRALTSRAAYLDRDAPPPKSGKERDGHPPAKDKESEGKTERETGAEEGGGGRGYYEKLREKENQRRENQYEERERAFREMTQREEGSPHQGGESGGMRKKSKRGSSSSFSSLGWGREALRRDDKGGSSSPSSPAAAAAAEKSIGKGGRGGAGGGGFLQPKNPPLPSSEPPPLPPSEPKLPPPPAPQPLAPSQPGGGQGGRTEGKAEEEPEDDEIDAGGGAELWWMGEEDDSDGSGEE